VIDWFRNVRGKESVIVLCVRKVAVGVVNEEKKKIFERRTKQLQVQPNWRSGQTVLKRL
jgi:hypothetical protein